MFYYREIHWCRQQRSAVPLIHKADVPFLQLTQVSLGLGFCCVACDRLSSWNVSSVAPLLLAVRETEAISHWLWVGTVITHPQCPRPTHESKRSVWSSLWFPLTENVFSFAELLFQINITITLLQKEKTKHTPHKVQPTNRQNWSCALFFGCVILQTRWSSLEMTQHHFL